MANAREKRGLGEKTISHDAEVREIVPSSGWTEDSNAHYLLLKLPDFKTEEVKLDVDESGRLRVSGERLETAAAKFKIIMFDQTYTLPQNSDIDQISGKVEEDNILRIIVPKRPLEDHDVNYITQENHETIDYVENGQGDAGGGGGGFGDVGGGGGGGYGRIKIERKQKNPRIDGNYPREVIVVMAVLALLLAIVYRVFGSAGHEKGV